MSNDYPYENNMIESMMRNLEITTKIFASHPALDFAVKQENMLGPLSGIQAALGITQQFSDIFSANDLMANSFLSTFDFQRELLSNTKNYYLTETLNSFRNNLIHNKYFDAIESITNSLRLPIIEAPHIALLKLNKSLMEITQHELPLYVTTFNENLVLCGNDYYLFTCGLREFILG